MVPLVLQPVGKRRNPLLLWGALLLYVAIAGTVAWNHEPWFDEAQAWLIAREAGFSSLFVTHLRYEGAPGLWYLILKGLQELGTPYPLISIFSMAIATVGIAIILFYAPFPLPLRLALPFSYFLLYQYAVIARSYVLLPLLLFLLAHLYPQRSERPLTWSLMLALLAHTSIHGTLLALGFLADTILALRTTWSSLGRSAQQEQRWAVLFLLLNLALIAMGLLPSATEALTRPALFHSIDPFTMIQESLTGNFLLSMLILSTSMAWFYEVGTLPLFLLLLLPQLLLASLKYAHVWHEGVIVLLWIATLWVSATEHRRSKREALPALTTIALAIVLAIQMGWGLRASWNDFHFPYSGSKALASHLKEQKVMTGSIRAMHFSTIALLPYFEENILAVERSLLPFWPHALTKPPPSPPRIIVGLKEKEKPQGNVPPIIPGYELQTIFPGQIFWKDRILEDESFALYERRG